MTGAITHVLAQNKHQLFASVLTHGPYSLLGRVKSDKGALPLLAPRSASSTGCLDSNAPNRKSAVFPHFPIEKAGTAG